MSRTALKFFAVVLGILIVVVLFAGFDDLPRGVRAQIDTERAALVSAQGQLRAASDEVNRDLRDEAGVFRFVPASQQWQGRMAQAAAQMEAASRDVQELSRLEKQNRRRDGQQVASLLSRERGLRAGAAGEAGGIRNEAARWVDLKQNLPRKLGEMEQADRAIREFDLAPLAAAVQRAGSDWPEKKADLDSRLAAVRGSINSAEAAWESSADARRKAAAGDFSGIVTLGSVADSLKSTADGLPKQAAGLKSLAGQLYYSSDKMLVDMEARDSGRNGPYRQKIRTVQTHFADASAKSGETTSGEQWVDVPRPVFEAMKGNLGMAIEHKPAGKYDSEADRVAQPAGFAYIAPPSQGSNQYGRWERRDGRDFWVFYGQYALMRDLLFNHDYRPLDRGDWDGYRTSQQRGQTYYGRDESAGAPRYGSQGTATQDRYSGSSYGKSGGFKDSKYAAKSGSYGGSKYATPGGDRTPKRFGAPGGSGSAPPSGSYRPAPRSAPSYHPPSRSPGRSFGRRR